MSARRVDAASIQVNDVLVITGCSRPVTRIEPYNGTLSGGQPWRIAYSGDDWCITLIPGQSIWRVTTS